MANLLGQNIGLNYKGILNLNTLNGNLSSTLQAVTDGDGNASPLTLSTSEVGINRTIALSAGATNVRLINETYTINNPGVQTGILTGIFLNATETALNGMSHNLMDLQVGGVSRFRVTNAGDTIQSNSFYVTGASQFISSPRFRGPNAFFFLTEGGADGTALFTNSAQNGFNRLQFGGTTNAFPSIKRNGTGIDFRLADDSALCSISINSLDAAANLQLGATGNIRFAGITKIQSPSAGIITLGNDAVTDFSRLQFGGTTSSFPAIARSSTNAVICLANATAGAGLGVGMASATGLAASAILQADSTTKGFLPPRMTTAQRDLIATPAAGLVIYNTSTNVLNFYNGSVWGAV